MHLDPYGLPFMLYFWSLTASGHPPQVFLNKSLQMTGLSEFRLLQRCICVCLLLFIYIQYSLKKLTHIILKHKHTDKQKTIKKTKHQNN